MSGSTKRLRRVSKNDVLIPKAGPRGISVVGAGTIAGRLLLRYSDGREEDAGYVVGPQGPEGKRGEKGAKGEPGAPGRDGLPGSDGQDGTPGRDGQDGKNGVDGKDGARGPQGPKGDRGPEGPRGPQGPVGPMPRHEHRRSPEAVHIRFEQLDGVWGEWITIATPALRQFFPSGGGGGNTGGTSDQYSVTRVTTDRTIPADREMTVSQLAIDGGALTVEGAVRIF